MMNIELISRLLRESNLQLAFIGAPGQLMDFLSVKEAVMFQLHINSINHFLDMMALEDEAAIKAQFVHLCRVYDAQNKGTALHFAHDPTNNINALYFNIAKALYPEASFLTLLRLLCPSILYQKGLDWEVLTLSQGPNKRKKTEQIRLTKVLIEESDSSLSAPAAILPVSLDIFKRLVFENDSVFFLDEIEVLDFKRHQQFYQELVRNDLPLLTAIKAHNESIAELYTDIARLADEGATLGEVFLPIIERMSISGMGFQGTKFASDEGDDAAKRLLAYYDRLSPEIQLSLDRCISHHHHQVVFSEIIAGMRNYDCIEVSAEFLNAFLFNAKNKDILSIRPHLSELEVAAIFEKYKRPRGECLLKLNHVSMVMKLPPELLRPLYAQIVLSNLDVLVGYLISFPIDEYPLFIASYIQDEYFDLLNHDFPTLLEALNETQCSAFLNALILARDRFDSRILLSALIEAKRGETIQQLLNSFLQDERMAIVKSKNINGYLLLQEALAAPDMLMAIFSCFSMEDIAFLLQESNGEGRSLFHEAIYFPQCLEKILTFLPVALWMPLLSMNSGDKQSVWCYAVTYHMESVSIVYNKLPPSAHLNLIKMQDVSDGNMVHWAAQHNTGSLILLINLFSEEVCVSLAKAKNKFGENALYLAIANIESLKVLLSLYPCEEQLPVLCEILSDDGCVLDHLAKAPENALHLLSVFKKMEVREAYYQALCKLNPDLSVSWCSSPDRRAVFAKLLPESFSSFSSSLRGVRFFSPSPDMIGQSAEESVVDEMKTALTLGKTP